MPIHISDNEVIIYRGEEIDVAVSTAESDDKENYFLVFHQGEPEEIKKYLESDKVIKVKEIDGPLVGIRFDDIKQVDSIIEELQKIKINMESD